MTSASYQADALIAEDIEAYLTQHQDKSLLRFKTPGLNGWQGSGV